MNRFPVPSVLQCTHFVAKSPGKQMRIVRDYEFDFYVDGQRDMYIDNKYYKISKGALVFRKPGQIVVGYGDYNTYILTLDFSQKNIIPPDKYVRGSTTPEQESCDFDMLYQIPTVFFPYHQDDLTDLYKKLISCSYPNIVNSELQKKYVTEFLFLVLSDALKHNREISDIKNIKESHIEKACKYINRNYSQNISIDDIADYLSLNKNYMIRLFKKELSITPNQYLLQIRLFHAKLMLMQTQLSIKRISINCGFNTEAYFIKCFKTHFGQTPMNYRKSILIKNDIPTE